ncbi:hypothetical protein HK104_002542 [Borealophlyctis nickersoniae]|nr:hypothetical protein HK104_002542 [Borealophlyctis nickersoniae]
MPCLSLIIIRWRITPTSAKCSTPPWSWGTPPEWPLLLMLALCFEHFNVVRAMAAAGVDVLSIFSEYYQDYDEDLPEWEPFKFLVEELGYEPPRHLLSHVVQLGQCVNAAYLVSRGADPSTIGQSVIEAVVKSDNHETLEWLLENRPDLQADEMLGYLFESDCPTQDRIFGTVGVLLQQGADPLFIQNDKPLLERAVEKQLWEVAGMMLACMDPSAAMDYRFLKHIATEE